jgi:hypothetical protein
MPNTLLPVDRTVGKIERAINPRHPWKRATPRTYPAGHAANKTFVLAINAGAAAFQGRGDPEHVGEL